MKDEIDKNMCVFFFFLFSFHKFEAKKKGDKVKNMEIKKKNKVDNFCFTTFFVHIFLSHQINNNRQDGF